MKDDLLCCFAAKLFFRFRRNNFGFDARGSFRIFFRNNGKFQIQIPHSEEGRIASPKAIDFYLFELVPDGFHKGGQIRALCLV